MSSIFVLTGAPGCGKTTILREINDAFHPDWLHREPERYNGNERDWIEQRVNCALSHNIEILFDRFLESSWIYAERLSEKVASIDNFNALIEMRNVVFINIEMNEDERTSNILHRDNEHKQLFPYEICEDSHWFSIALNKFLKRAENLYVSHNVHIVSCTNSLRIPIRIVANSVLEYVQSATRAIKNYEIYCQRTENHSAISLSKLLRPIRCLNRFTNVSDEMLSGLHGSAEELYRRGQTNE